MKKFETVFMSVFVVLLSRESSSNLSKRSLKSKPMFSIEYWKVSFDFESSSSIFQMLGLEFSFRNMLSIFPTSVAIVSNVTSNCDSSVN